MGKICSEKERKLQKKLIPLNIFVCILALVAAFSLMFGPIFKINFGKILSSPATIEFVEKSIGDMMNGSSGGGEDGEEDGDAGANAREGELSSVDFMPVVTTIVTSVLGSAEGSVEFSAFNASKVAFASGDEKANKVLNELFFGDNALVTKLINSVVDSVLGLFDTEEGKDIIAEVVVMTIATSIVSDLSDDAAKALTENFPALKESFKSFETVESREAAEQATDAFIDKLDEVLGEEYSKEDFGEPLHEFIMNMYDVTAEKTGKTGVSMEEMVSVMVSSNVDLSEFDISKIFGGAEGPSPEPTTEPEQPEGAAVKRIVTADEIEGGEGGEPSATPVEPPPGEDTPEEDRKICTSYDEMLKEMGFGADEKEELKVNLKTALEEFIRGYTEPAEQYLGYYGYLFYGMLVFIVPWLILFLFSFFHLFAKNKRFMMWYVKLYSWIPGLIAFAFIVAPKILSKTNLKVEGIDPEIVKVILGSVSSLMWISGICYLLLWLVSIFWAFPIKHKIRKERKFVKQNGYSSDDSYGGGSYGDSSDNGNKSKKSKKDKKAAKNRLQPYQPYGVPPYGGNQYGAPPYGGNQYGAPLYGGNQYGNPYDNNTYGNPYGSDPYGAPPYGGVLDDDADGFDAPYTGSYYGSYYDDDDL